MHYSNQRRFWQQASFLRRQFLQDGDLPFTNVLTEGVISHALTAINVCWLDRIYSTQETAEILNKRPYTVRNWCQMGRVYAEKIESGRGVDGEWRISHAELVRIQNEGLIPFRRKH